MEDETAAELDALAALGMLDGELDAELDGCAAPAPPPQAFRSATSAGASSEHDARQGRWVIRAGCLGSREDATIGDDFFAEREDHVRTSCALY